MSSYREPSVSGDPIVFLMGCRPWPPPGHDGDYLNASKKAVRTRRPPKPPKCPVCGNSVGLEPMSKTGEGPLVTCAWCAAASPALLRLIRLRETGRLNSTSAAAAASEQQARRRLEKQAKQRLSESDRRRLWNGYRGGNAAESDEVSNLAAVGRKFLAEIGQEPDWSLVLDSRGRVVGATDSDDPDDAPD